MSNLLITISNLVIAIDRKQSGQHAQVAWNVNAIYVQNMMIQ